MDINAAFPTKYIKAADLQGREIQVIIDRVVMEPMDKRGQQVMTPIIYFQGKQKGLVLNKTNAKNVAAIYGTNTDGWIGKSITLMSAWVDYQGQTVEAIRIRPAPGQTMGQFTSAPQAPLQQHPQTQAQQYGPPQEHPADLDDDSIPF